jgi:hypothetical protein
MDRAHIVAVALVQMFLRYLVRSWNDGFVFTDLCNDVASYLRDEFADIKREAAADRPDCD